MAYKLNNCEGATDGTSISTTNSDDNGAGDALAVSTGGTRIYSSAWANNGTTCWDCSGTSGNTAILGFTQTASAGMSVRVYFRVTALPAATCAFLQMRSDTDSASGAIQMKTDGALEIGTHGGVAATTTMACSVDTTYRIEWRQIKGTGSGDGTVGFKIFAGESTSPLETYESSAQNCGTNDFAAFRLGKITGIASTFAVMFDDVAMEDQGTTYLGPLLGSSDLTFTTARKITVDCTGSTGTLTCTQTTGTSVGSISGPTSSVFTITLPDHKDVLVFEVEADGDGDPVTDTFKVYPDNLSNVLVYAGGGASDITNWE